MGTGVPSPLRALRQKLAVGMHKGLLQADRFFPLARIPLLVLLAK